MRIYTDGACSGNPGPGGWGWIADDGRSGSGGEPQTTNQRMELAAVLDALGTVSGPIEIYSDSTYVVNCFKDRWYEGWRKRGWRNANKKPVANRDLWEPLIDLYLERSDEVQFFWVKGHSGDPMNDEADRLAVAASAAYKPSGGQTGGPFDKIAAPWPLERTLWAVGVTELDAEGRARLDQLVRGLEPGHDVLLSGLRRGTELTAAEIGRAHGVDLAVVLPFEDPARDWSPLDRDRFDAMRAAAEWCLVLPGDRAQPGKAVEQRNVWVATTVVGALVIGEEALARDLDEAGLTVLD
jgi:ribonuclease HI